ncbi:hypothetical protein KEM48_012168 [Puccinia striiformis f. sp. tritici PST-130]|uniref:C2H2-type domain-containing protein n=1 Tax=Puccinia striiformis f. sp. tritici PST-78 TaxID=1165861 RepID=A0A0L0VDL7_9BASI|nr:hypothetical protein KEM48_012168 [Puccinia striiformis f. sp. tritici PST-130]KNE97049.1 hypothetical protein PSTG_09623 [Puccinia striiformis f. sp. tritici PST-78]
MRECEIGARTVVANRFGGTLELTDDIEALSVQLDSEEDLATTAINTRSGLATRRLRAPTNRGRFDSLNRYFLVKGDVGSYQCNWCSKVIRTPLTSRTNLRYHRDGSIISGRLRAACPGRWRAIAAGCNLQLATSSS